MSDLERFLELAAAELGNIDRRAQPQRHRQQQGQASHRQGAHQQRKDAELRMGSDVGRHSGLVKNSTRSSLPKSTGAASRKTKKKMARTKRIALQPQSRMIHSTSGSVRSKAR